MEDSEKGRLYPMKADGSEMAPFIIKKPVLFIGSGDSCGIRIYTDGIYPEHCALTTGKKGKVYFEPLHPTALALVNQDKITKKCLLKQDDVITILVKNFRFAYPANSLQSQISVKIPILPGIVMEAITPKRRISSARTSVSPKRKALLNVDDNLHILRVKRPATGMGTELDTLKKKKLSVCDKKVRFGPKLTPEEFDKHLPPSSPLRRGSLPGETYSKVVVKQRLSYQLSPNILKRKKVSVTAKRLSSDPKRISFPPQSAKTSRGSPLIDKSLNIANESITTLTVNAEVHSGPKSKVELSIKSMPSHKKSTSFSSIESGGLYGTSPDSVPVEDIAIFESPVSKITPSKYDKNSCNKEIHQDFCDTSCISLLKETTKISQSPSLEKAALKSEKSIGLVSSAMDKRPLFSEILKKHKANSDESSTLSEAKSPKLRTCLKKTSKCLVNKKSSEKLIHRQILAVGSTGHANSPDTIILRKRKITEVDDVADVINVRRSPRTPRRAKYNTTIRKTSNLIKGLKSESNCVTSLEKLPEDNITQDSETTPTQLKNSNELEKEIYRKQDSQCEDICHIETEVIKSANSMLPQLNDDIAVGQMAENVIEKITTPCRKSRKTQEFVLKASSNLSFGKESKENEDVLLESCIDTLFGQFHEEGIKQDIKVTPNRLRRSRESQVEFIKKIDSELDDLNYIETSELSTNSKDLSEFISIGSCGKVQKELEKYEATVSPTQSKSKISGNDIKNHDSLSDDLCNFDTGGAFTTSANMQSELGVVLSTKCEEDLVKQNANVTLLESKKSENSEIKFMKNPDSPSDDLHNTVKNGYSENELDAKLQSFSPKDDVKDVKEIKKNLKKQTREDIKLLQNLNENKDEKLDDLIEPDGYSENETDSKLEFFSLKDDVKDVKEIKKRVKKQTRKGRKLLQNSKENNDEKLENLIEPGKCSENSLDLKSQPLLSMTNENEVVKETKQTMKQYRKGRKQINVPQEDMEGKLHDSNIQSGYSENETDLKLQSFRPKDDVKDVKEIKKKVKKQTREDRKLLQNSKENKDEKLDDLIEPVKCSENSWDLKSQPLLSMTNENEVVKETKQTMKQSRKGRKQLDVPQEDIDGKLHDSYIQSEYSENIIDVKSPLVDSLYNEKENENEKSLELKGKKYGKKSRNKKVLNDNEEIQLRKDSSDLGKSPEKTINLNCKGPDDASVQGTTQEIVKTNANNIDKPQPKRRKVKKDCSAGEEKKPIAHELSPCRRVTRSMAKKYAPK